jgi:homoserine dehydrogenase
MFKKESFVNKKSIGVGLMGMGVIGGQVAKVLMDASRHLSEDVGCPIILKKIKVIPADLERPEVKAMGALVTTDENEF